MTDTELRDYCKWYQGHFRKDVELKSVYVTGMCGRFHSYPKAMTQALRRMQALGLVEVKSHMVTIQG